MLLRPHKQSALCPRLLLVVTGSLFLVPWNAFGQYTAAPVTVSEPVAVQMIQAWAKTLTKNDVAGLGLYYADPLMADPWRQRITAAPIRSANLVAINGINPAPEKMWGGVPLSGEVRFTVDFQLEGYSGIVRETRVWGLTNKNGYLQVANEMREQAPEGGTPEPQSAAFPKFGNDPAPVIAQAAAAGTVVAVPTPAPQQTGANPLPTLTRNEAPIEKAKLIQELWDQLLTRYKKAYEMRSEQLYLKCFAAKPDAALVEFQDRMTKYGWLQILDLAIDEDSVRGNQLNAQFRFRYSLWGPGLKKGEIIEVNAAATKGGQGWSPGWRFSQFGAEVVMKPQRPPGYYPTQAMMQSAITPGVPGQQQAQPRSPFNWFRR